MTKLLRAPVRFGAPALFLSGLSACAMIPDAPIVAGVPLSQSSPAALGQPVQVGSIVATPIAVAEDSRCPAAARCVWAGRLVVTTRIDGTGWRETADLTLGEPFGTHDLVLTLTSGSPAPQSRARTAPEDYRFTYELR